MPELTTRLYLVTPPLVDAGFLPRVEAALGAGDVACLFVRLAPLSDRNAKEVVRRIAATAQPLGVALLVADPRLASHTGADGVHIDRGEALAQALDSLKPERIVGMGGLASRDEAMRAGEAGVDYLMFGEATASDPQETLEQVGWWAEIFNIPCVGFAHDLARVETLASAGAEFVALGDAVWAHPEGPARAVASAQAALLRAASLAPALPA